MDYRDDGLGVSFIPHVRGKNKAAPADIKDKNFTICYKPQIRVRNKKLKMPRSELIQHFSSRAKRGDDYAKNWILWNSWNYPRNLELKIAAYNCTTLLGRYYHRQGAEAREKINAEKKKQKATRFLTSIGGELPPNHESWKPIRSRSNLVENVATTAARGDIAKTTSGTCKKSGQDAASHLHTTHKMGNVRRPKYHEGASEQADKFEAANRIRKRQEGNVKTVIGTSEEEPRAATVEKTGDSESKTRSTITSSTRNINDLGHGEKANEKRHKTKSLDHPRAQGDNVSMRVRNSKEKHVPASEVNTKNDQTQKSREDRKESHGGEGQARVTSPKSCSDPVMGKQALTGETEGLSDKMTSQDADAASETRNEKQNRRKRESLAQLKADADAGDERAISELKAQRDKRNRKAREKLAQIKVGAAAGDNEAKLGLQKVRDSYTRKMKRMYRDKKRYRHYLEQKIMYRDDLRARVKAGDEHAVQLSLNAQLAFARNDARRKIERWVTKTDGGKYLKDSERPRFSNLAPEDVRWMTWEQLEKFDFILPEDEWRTKRGFPPKPLAT